MQVPFPIAYFGSIAYFQALSVAGDVVLELHEHFPKQTFRNRCSILGANGLHLLTLPVVKPNGSKTPTGAIQCSDQNDWVKLHWRAIQSAYSNAPYYEHYEQDIHQLIHTKHTSLAEKNFAIIQFFIKSWELPVHINFSEFFLPITDSRDYRIRDFDNIQELQVNRPYTQVQFTSQNFTPNCSVLDLLFCEGPLGRKHILL